MAVTDAVKLPKWELQSHFLREFQAMPENANDERLIEHMLVLRAQVGDAEAHARLVDRYWRRLLYYVRRIVGREVDAEDVVQDTWLEVVRWISSIENPQSFRTWIYKVARNKAISKLRKLRREVPIEEASEEDHRTITEGTESPDSETFGAYDSTKLHVALGRLTAPHREVLTLRFLEELSYDEISTVIGCSVGTVRSRIHYGKKALQEQLLSG